MNIDIIKKRETYYLRIFILITVVLAILIWIAEKSYLFISIPLIQFIPLLIFPELFYKKVGKIEFNENQILIEFINNL